MSKSIDMKSSLYLFVFFLWFSVTPIASFAAWTTEVVDAPKYFSRSFQRALAVDGSNHPHIAYGGDHLYHAYFDGTQWQYETVDSAGNVGDYTSIAVDSNNKVHISYCDVTNGDLKYATNASGSWVTQTIDSAGNVGGFTSVAVDSNNNVHIGYCDWTNYDLKYATNASGSWVTQTVDSAGNVGGFTSIAVDSNNKVHISSFEATNGNLRYATNASGSWVTQTVDGPWSGGPCTSIAVDSDNNVHISYLDGIHHDLKYATNASGLWVTETVDTAGDVGDWTSIAIDSDNKAHISYYDRTNYDLKYATNASGSWVTQIVDNAVGWYGYTSIAIDSNNKVHISYYDSTNYDLRYATNASGSWVIVNVDNSGYLGEDTSEYTSIAVDSNNRVHISYYAWGYVKYATNASGPWVIQTFDGAASVGWYTSIAIDSFNRPHISYSDVYNNNLKYATGFWVTKTVDSAGSVGGYTSIAVDSNNKAHISYFDWINADLKYATNVLGSWVTQTVDSVGEVGEYTSIAIADNKVHISYYDRTNGDLKCASNDMPDTTTPTTTALPAGGTYSSAQSVTLTCDDGSGSGCNITYYCLYSGCLPTTIYNGSISISSSTTLRFRSIDNDGNLEFLRTELYTINTGCPVVTVNRPNGGEIIPSGSQYTTSWCAPSEAVRFTLKYSIDNGSTWKLIVKNVTGTSYNWLVPTPPNNRKECLMKVIGFNASGTQVGSDKSNSTFTIEVVKLTSPDGEEILQQSNTHTITWQTNATIRPVAQVKLSYSVNGGTSWTAVKTLTGNPGSYNWTVPNVSSSSCKVKVVLKDSGGVTVGNDITDGVFTIQP